MIKYLKIFFMSLCIVFAFSFTAIQANEKNVFPDKTVEIDLDDDTSTEVVEEEQTPKSTLIEGKWSILNLVCLIGIGITEVLIFTRKASDGVDDETLGQLREEGIDLESNSKLNIIGFVVFLASLLVFFLNENMRLSCVLFDKWSMLMISLLVVNIFLLYLKTKKTMIKSVSI